LVSAVIQRCLPLKNRLFCSCSSAQLHLSSIRMYAPCPCGFCTAYLCLRRRSWRLRVVAMMRA
jgi:hypothetical protein